MGLFQKKAPPLSRDEALACIPVISEAVSVQRTETGVVRLRYPLLVKPWLADLARRFGAGPGKPPARQLELDDLGTLTWELIDGKRSVLSIVRRFAQQTRVHPKEAEAAVTRFLRELGRRGIVGLAPPRTNRRRQGE